MEISDVRARGFCPKLAKVGNTQTAHHFPAPIHVVKHETDVYCVCLPDTSRGSARTCRHDRSSELTATQRGTRRPRFHIPHSFSRVYDGFSGGALKLHWGSHREP